VLSCGGQAGLGGRQWAGVAAMNSCCETVASHRGQKPLSTEAEKATAFGAVTKQRLLKAKQIQNS
jgi:hypothetical protein